MSLCALTVIALLVGLSVASVGCTGSAVAVLVGTTSSVGTVVGDTTMASVGEIAGDGSDAEVAVTVAVGLS